MCAMTHFKYTILFLSCLNFNLLANEINFLVHPLTPFIIKKDGNYSGFAIEIVNELIQQNNTFQNYAMMPFPRALKTVQKLDDYALFIVARTQERENTIKWVGPIISSNVYLYKHRNNPIKVHSLDDIKGKYRIGVGRGNTDHNYLATQGFSKLYPVGKQSQSLLMLANNRIDFAPMSELVMPEVAIAANINVDDIENTYIKLYESELYLAFSNNIDDDVINKWQQSLDKFKQTAKFAQIQNKYLR